jgi:hypothetical protein
VRQPPLRQSLFEAGVCATVVNVNGVTLSTWVEPKRTYETVTSAIPAVAEDSRSCESIDIVVSWTCVVGKLIAANTPVPAMNAPTLVVMVSWSTSGDGAMKARVMEEAPSAGALVTSAQ